jgi:hypothetical protein
MRAVSRAGYGIFAPCHTLKAAENRPSRVPSWHGFYLALIFGSLIFEESAICISPYQPADASLGRNSGRYNPAYYCHSESFPVSLNTAPYSYHPA